jgi:protein-tyrosine phosphatase
MAEGIARDLARKRGISNLIFFSAGTACDDGFPPAENAVLTCAEIRVDISSHRSRRLTPEMVSTADLIFGMEYAHLEFVRNMKNGMNIRVELLAGDAEIPDPIGEGVEFYEIIRDKIKKDIERILVGVIDRID